MGQDNRWGVGDPIGLGNDIGAPEVPYMSYGPQPVETYEERILRVEKEEKEREIERLRLKSNRISDEAWDLYEEKRYDDSLIFINRALERFDGVANTWNRKAIILDKMGRYEEALSNYDRAIELEPSQTFRRNKAGCLVDYCYLLKDRGNDGEGLEKIDEALNIFQRIDDVSCEDEAWYLKGIFMERSDDIPEAFNCYRTAFGLADEGNEMKRTYKENMDRLLEFIDDKDIVCPNCGNEVKITDNVCFKCGAHIADFANTALKNQTFKSGEWERDAENGLGSSILHFDEE